MSQALIDRWTTFISKVSDRLDAIIAEAGPGLLAVGRAHPDDPLPLGNAITGLDHRVGQLATKLSDTWDDSVEPKFDAAGPSAWETGRRMLEDAQLEQAHRWQKAKAGWLTTLADEGKLRAEAAEAEPVPCRQCGAPLALPTRRKSVSQPCAACGSVNQVSPSAPIRAYYGALVQHAAEAVALPHRQAVERFRLEVERRGRANDHAHEGLESLERWRELERAVYRAQAGEVARRTGEPVDEVWIDGRMGHFMKWNHDRDQFWVRAHGKGSR
jgi:hypothetical protein